MASSSRKYFLSQVNALAQTAKSRIPRNAARINAVKKTTHTALAKTYTRTLQTESKINRDRYSMLINNTDSTPLNISADELTDHLHSSSQVMQESANEQQSHRRLRCLFEVAVVLATSCEALADRVWDVLDYKITDGWQKLARVFNREYYKRAEHWTFEQRQAGRYRLLPHDVQYYRTHAADYPAHNALILTLQKLDIDLESWKVLRKQIAGRNLEAHPDVELKEFPTVLDIYLKEGEISPRDGELLKSFVTHVIKFDN